MEVPTLEETYYNLAETNFWTKLFPTVCYKIINTKYDLEQNIEFINNIESLGDILMIGPYSVNSYSMFDYTMSYIITWIKIFVQDKKSRRIFVKNLQNEYLKIRTTINVRIPVFIINHINSYAIRN
jgi:hypothetical protein